MDMRMIRKGVVGLSKAALKLDRAPDEIIAERKGICAKCEHKKIVLDTIMGKDMNVSKCTVCKCYINAKVLILGEKCPLQKW